ncbi:DUF2384 domain-containing protein [Parashewanella spongiae]|uniref:DUF2384 domain-containing protein n=1 Tax=Parashewanella spongiae TaxID=342950 RepID=A0A3A6ULI1_9GAMM|nr:antitoxin Xre/MbcA/ParS toxin-binding domain-containing protein [Parashewanella spongiae]MCL1077287.1 DUF2384 domain-containing protein [Parashewanella spongiae]RJY18533.1 DUF2384 domain-containing protein [Parashewanella spongiae]
MEKPIKQTRSFKPRPPVFKELDYWQAMGVLDEQTKTQSAAITKGYQFYVCENLLKKTKMSQLEFQSITHIPMSTLKRRLKNKERFSTQESDVIYRFAKIVELSIELFATEEKAMQWIRSEIRGLDYKKPIDMINTSIDFQSVKDLIGRLQHGVVT